MEKNKKLTVFIIMMITSIIASCIIICLTLSFNINIFIPMIMIGIGLLTGTILLIKCWKLKAAIKKIINYGSNCIFYINFSIAN